MGKTTAATMLRRMGVPVHDSDAAVHRAMAPGGGAVGPIDAAFGDVVRDGAIDRRRLGAIVFEDAAALKRLEAILHPLVAEESNRFLAIQARHGRAVTALDIPLLLETGQQDRVDSVVVVSAPAFIQRIRVLARPGMTCSRLEKVLARQMPDPEKRRLADRVVPTGLGRIETWRHLAAIVRAARADAAEGGMAGRRPAWPPRAWPRSSTAPCSIWLRSSRCSHPIPHDQ